MATDDNRDGRVMLHVQLDEKRKAKLRRIAKASDTTLTGVVEGWIDRATVRGETRGNSSRTTRRA